MTKWLSRFGDWVARHWPGFLLLYALSQLTSAVVELFHGHTDAVALPLLVAVACSGWALALIAMRQAAADLERAKNSPVVRFSMN